MSPLQRTITGTLTALVVWLAAMGTVEAVGWVGQPFPGFLVLENRVVASVGFSHWPATTGGEIYQHEIVAVDGAPLENVHALKALVGSLPAGTSLIYSFRRGERKLERTIPTRLFGRHDFALLFGVYLLNGLVMGGVALGLWLLRGRHAGARTALPFLLVGALWGLTALDLYGPYRLFRLHALCESFLFAAILHLAIGFARPPLQPARRAQLLRASYACSAALALLYQLALGRAEAYVASHLLATSALGLSLVILVVTLCAGYLRSRRLPFGPEVRDLALGAAFSLALPISLTLGESFTGGCMPQNAVGFTAFLLPLSICYAVRRGRPALATPGR